ncbi:hypothetical protein FOCC_FOCC010711, partial [Frankliniella occidentalis]
MASLERLNLSGNSLSSRPLSADLFKDLGKLNKVSLAHNKIAGELNADTLPWSGSILELDLSYNGLTSVSAGAWRRLPNIKVLDMSHNKLSSLTPDAFLELRSLERLDLSWNALTALAPGSLAGLAGLRTLVLAHNALRGQGLPTASFTQLAALDTLDLSSNAISLHESAGALSALPAALRSLDLSHNPLGRAEGGLEGQTEAAATLPATLESLSLAHCNLHGLDVRSWGGLAALRRLQLAGNDISVLSSLAHLDALAELNVSSNALTRFPTVALPALRSLDVTHNHLERAPTPFSPLLAVMRLDDNPLEELRIAASPALALLSVRGMPQLRSLPRGAVHLHAAEAPANATAPCLALLLSHNPMLGEVHEDALRNITFCQLDMSHNALEWLDPRATDWSAVPSLDLQGNPWKCSCRLQWLLEGPMQHIYRSSPALLEDLRCSSPETVSGRRLVHWFNHTGRALCDGELMDLQSAGTVTFKMSPASLVVMGCLGVAAVGLVLLGILAHRRKHQIQKVHQFSPRCTERFSLTIIGFKPMASCCWHHSTTSSRVKVRGMKGEREHTGETVLEPLPSRAARDGGPAIDAEDTEAQRSHAVQEPARGARAPHKLPGRGGPGPHGVEDVEQLLGLLHLGGGARDVRPGLDVVPSLEEQDAE